MTSVHISEKGRIYILYAILVVGSAFGNLSETAVSSLMSGVMGDFGVTVDLAQWLTTGYMLALGITVPVATYLSRRFSVRQHIFLALSFFFIGSCAAVVAQNFEILFLGRICQAISTGMLLPLMQTVAMTSFSVGRQATAMGIAGIALGFAPNFGPTVAGVMIYLWGWRSFFVLLVVLAAVLLVATFLFVPSSPARDKSARLETLSLILSTLGFGGLLLGCSNASSYSFTSGFVLAPVLVGIICLILFVVRQKKLAQPLVSMDIFSNSRFSQGFIAQNLLFASFMGVVLIAPLYVEDLCGGSSLEAGMVLLPGTLIALVVNPFAGALTDRIGIRPVALVSGLFLVVGSVLMSFLDVDSPLWLAMVFQSIRSAGVSGLIGPLTSWSLSDLPRPLMPDGSSFSIAIRQVCASLGTSLMVLVLTAAAATSLGLVNPSLAYQISFAFSALLACVTFGFIVVKVR